MAYSHDEIAQLSGDWSYICPSHQYKLEKQTVPATSYVIMTQINILDEIEHIQREIFIPSVKLCINTIGEKLNVMKSERARYRKLEEYVEIKGKIKTFPPQHEYSKFLQKKLDIKEIDISQDIVDDFVKINDLEEQTQKCLNKNYPIAKKYLMFL